MLLNLINTELGKSKENKCWCSQVRISLQALFITVLFCKAPISGRFIAHVPALIRLAETMVVLRSALSFLYGNAYAFSVSAVLNVGAACFL